VEAELRGMAIYQTELDWKMFIPPLPAHQVIVAISGDKIG
jgi:hypothetical protein